MRMPREFVTAMLVWKPDFASEMARARVDRLARGDWRRMETVLAGPTVKTLRPEQLAVTQLDLAFLQRNYPAAELALSATKAADFPGGGYVTPREWYAALIAVGLGDADKAQAPSWRPGSARPRM